jgi:hypothetical protein
MKYNKYYILGVLATGLLATSCSELDTHPEGQLTGKQYAESLEKDPSLLAASVSAINYTVAKEYCVFGQASGRGDDFGWPAFCLSEGCNSADITSVVSGYNWFSTASTFDDRNPEYANPYERWAMFYNQIKACNDLLDQIPAGTQNKKLKQYMGIAKTVRAWDYLMLVQAYAKTYVGHKDDPAVPLYISKNEEGYAELTSARQTVETIYNKIEKDLTEAAAALDGFQRSDKTFVNQAVVFGLQARVALIKNNWSEAETLAQKAIDAAAAEGIAPASIADVSKVGQMFYSISENNWMWGMSFLLSNIPSDGEYETWVSQISSLASYSYTTETGSYRAINSHLWNTISSTDVRKGWWVDENLSSPLIKGLQWSNSGESADLGRACGNLVEFIPYTNVKFGCYNGELGTTHTCADFPFMRVEEMYLIKAEAQAQAGNDADATTTLESFVKTYRDPSYSVASAPVQNLVDEIWRQRRIELWGEGFAISDVMRLKKPVVRFLTLEGEKGNFPSAWQFNIPAEDDILLNIIPTDEINGNDAISESDQNPTRSVPSMGEHPELRDGVTDNF